MTEKVPCKGRTDDGQRSTERTIMWKGRTEVTEKVLCKGRTVVTEKGLRKGRTLLTENGPCGREEQM